MIASWMLYGIVVGLLITLTALAAERAARVTGRPTRFIWLGATMLTALWPIGALSITALRSRALPQAASAPVIISTPAATADRGHVTTDSPASPTMLGRIAEQAAAGDALLAMVWGIASLALLVQLLRNVRAVRRGPLEWRPRMVDGRPVLVSRGFGPAVVGLRDLRVVVPEWVLDLAPDDRALVLEHEHEHREARDPHALIIAALAATLVPWNPAIWIQARRLRLAIELDCDARVLARRGGAAHDVERYGSLLISIVERRLDASRVRERLGAGAVIVAALNETPSDLERRITAMISTRPRNSKSLATALFVAAAGALTIAWRAPAPADATPHFAWQQSPAYPANQVDVRASLRSSAGVPEYPRELSRSAIQGRVVASFIVGANGRVESSSVKLTEATHGFFAASVRSFLDTAAFAPATKGGRSVRQIVEMPFAFSLPNGTARVELPSQATPRADAPARVLPPRAADSARVGAAVQRADTASSAIRAPTSQSANGRPLFIVDGVLLTDTTGLRQSFDSLDIESVEVIRGAAAQALYGGRAEAGVIKIETKGGAGGALLRRKGGRGGGAVRVDTTTIESPAGPGPTDYLRGKVAGTKITVIPDTTKT